MLGGDVSRIPGLNSLLEGGLINACLEGIGESD